MARLAAFTMPAKVFRAVRVSMMPNVAINSYTMAFRDFSALSRLINIATVWATMSSLTGMMQSSATSASRTNWVGVLLCSFVPFGVTDEADGVSCSVAARCGGRGRRWTLDLSNETGSERGERKKSLNISAFSLSFTTSGSWIGIRYCAMPSLTFGPSDVCGLNPITCRRWDKFFPLGL